MDPIKQKIITTAVASRAFIWGLAIIADAIIPNHDAGVFTWTPSPQVEKATIGDTIISWLCDGLTRWDGQYFLHIANNGYTYENTLAFFPAYPSLVRIAGEILYWMQVDYGLLHFHSALKLSAILVNIGLFTTAALGLYDLSWRILRDEYLAYKATLFFILNPASIFFSAAYSEAFHSASTFFLLTFLDRGFSFKVGLLLAICSFNRSNALLNIGFIAYKCLKRVALELTLYGSLKKVQKHEFSSTLANIIGDALFPAFFCSLAAIGPFVLYQWYGFTLFCGLTKVTLNYDQSVIDYAHNHSLKLPSHEPSEWCFYQVPIPYSYIQSHYWNVGFLNYFHWKQIPNFVLAMPILSLVAHQSWRFFQHHKRHVLKLGLESAASVGSNFDTYGARILPKEAFVYVVHAAFLAIFAFFCIHVQVSTRMIASSTPVIYWWLAILTIPKDRKPLHKQSKEMSKFPRMDIVSQLETGENFHSKWKNLVFDERNKMPKSGVWLLNYFVFYACFGTVLFANFLPWT